MNDFGLKMGLIKKEAIILMLPFFVFLGFER